MATLLLFAIDAITHLEQHYFDLYSDSTFRAFYCVPAVKMVFDQNNPSLHPPEREQSEATKTLKTVPYDPRFPNQNQTR